MVAYEAGGKNNFAAAKKDMVFLKVMLGDDKKRKIYYQISQSAKKVSGNTGAESEYTNLHGKSQENLYFSDTGLVEQNLGRIHPLLQHFQQHW